MVPTKLSISHLSKSFGTLEVLKDISFDVKKGEFVSFIGPSGCGKSTLFNILATVEKETAGTIYLDGKQKKQTGNVGYMFQDPLLLPWKNALQNITVGQEVKGIAFAKTREQAYILLKKFGLAQFAYSYPATLSGGMKQRIALLRTIMFCNDLLLLDEPFGALDSLTRQSLQLWLMEVLHAFHATILFITHDIREAILLSDTIYVFSTRPGSIVKKITVDLPRPRKQKDVLHKKAIAIEQTLLQLLS